MSNHATMAKELLDEYLVWGGFGPVEHEFKFLPDRRFRFDWAFPDKKIAIEYDGIQGSGHASINGVLRDSEKLNLANLAGWRVYRVNTKTVHDGTAFTILDQALKGV